MILFVCFEKYNKFILYLLFGFLLMHKSAFITKSLSCTAVVDLFIFVFRISNGDILFFSYQTIAWLISYSLCDFIVMHIINLFRLPHFGRCYNYSHFILWRPCVSYVPSETVKAIPLKIVMWRSFDEQISILLINVDSFRLTSTSIIRQSMCCILLNGI